MLHGSPKNKRGVNLRVQDVTRRTIRALAASLDVSSATVVDLAVSEFASSKLPLSSPASDATNTRGVQAPATDK